MTNITLNDNLDVNLTDDSIMSMENVPNDVNNTPVSSIKTLFYYLTHFQQPLPVQPLPVQPSSGENIINVIDVANNNNHVVNTNINSNSNSVNVNDSGKDDSYQHTIAHWKRTTDKMLFDCKQNLIYYERIMSYTNLSVFLVSSVTTLVSVINYSNNNNSDTIKVTLTVLSTISAFISGTTKILSIQDKIKSCQTFLSQVDDFNSRLASRENLPSDLVTDEKQFVQNNMDTYYQICKGNNTYNS